MTTYFHTLKNYLFRAGLTPEEYKMIEKDMEKANRQNLMAFSVIASVFLLIMFILSFFSADAEVNRWIYLFSMIITLIILTFSIFLCDSHPVLLYTCIYLFAGILFIFGIILGTITGPDEQAVTFIALLLTVPLLFTDRPVRMIFHIYLYMILFTVIAFHTKEAAVLSTDFIDTYIFGTISSIISSYMMNVKCQRYLYEHRAVFLSETDLLTGLRSRNSYEKSLPVYPSQCRSSLACIFIDVNGLHELNKLQGHEAGDRMLQFISRNLQEQFGEKHSFRIGGDEFVAFVIDDSPECIRKKANILFQNTEQMSYHISIGIDRQTCPGIDIKALIQNAEKEMLRNKTLFYEERKIPRDIR